MKRRDENRQQSKEEFEAEFNGDGNGTNPGEESGNWVMAKDDVIKKRKIMKAKRIGGGVNTPFPGFKGGITNKEVAAPPVPSKSSNPFSGFSGLTGSFSSTPSSDTPRPKPSPVKSSSTTAAVAFQAVPAAAIATTSTGSNHNRGYVEAMRQLNKSFLEWVRRQQNENPMSTWSKGVKDYVDYVRKLVEKYPEHESENSVTTAAHGKEEGFSYSSPSLSSSPVAAVKSAATVFGGDSSTSASATSFSGAGLFGARTEPKGNGTTPSLFSAAPFMVQAGKGGGGNTYGSNANGGGTQDDNGEVDGDSMAKEKPTDLCRAEGEADEEVEHEVRAKLYKFNAAEKTFGDLGIGVLRAMRNVKTDSRRLVLRNDIGKVILNVIVYPGMTFDKQKSAVGFVASGEDGSSLVKYSIKVKQDNLEPFMKALEALVPPQK
eukprot:17215_1